MARKAEDRAGWTNLLRTNLLRNDDGLVAVIFALMLPVFVAIAALAIDMGFAFQKRNVLQVDASVSALAGAGFAMDDATATQSGKFTYGLVDKDGDGLPDNDDSNVNGVPDGAEMLLEAQYFSDLNIPAGEQVLATVDVVPGNWAPATRTFTRAGTWDPATLDFTADPATYDAATGTFTPVTDPIIPFNALFAVTRRAADGPNNNPLPLFLAGAVGLPQANINTPAIATIYPEEGDSQSCIHALDPDDEGALHIFGNAEVHAEDCDIQVDSCAEESTWFHGNPEIYVALEGAPEGGAINMCGTYRENGPVTVVGDINEDEDALGDPVSLTPPPGPHTCDHTDFTWRNGDPPIQPGVYCGGIKGTSVGTMVFCGQVPNADCAGGVTADNGLYIIKDGPLEVAGGAGVVAQGVTFYLTDGPGGPYSLVDFKGTSSTFLDMSASIHGDAPPGYDYTGVLFWHDCGGTAEECAGLTHNLRGTPNYGMEGLMYFPDSHVYVRGTADATGGANDCLMLIANTVELNGTTGLNVDNGCSNFGGLDDVFLADLVLRLVH